MYYEITLFPHLQLTGCLPVWPDLARLIPSTWEYQRIQSLVVIVHFLVCLVARFPGDNVFFILFLQRGRLGHSPSPVWAVSRADPMLVKFRATGVDVGPTLNQHWVNVSCLLHGVAPSAGLHRPPLSEKGRWSKQNGRHQLKMSHGGNKPESAVSLNAPLQH